MGKERNTKKALLSIDHYDSVRDPERLQEGRLEGMNVYEFLLQDISDQNKKS